MNDPTAGFSRRTLLKAGAGVAAGMALTGLGLAAPAFADEHTRPASSHGMPERLSSRQRLGQRVIYSYPGATPPAALFDAIAAGVVGGVIFFGENITSLADITAVDAELRAAQAKGPVRTPLLLMTDQEGGFIRRLPGQQPVLSEKQIGLSADPAAAAQAAGAGAAAALRAVGMNHNLAPVLDVFRTPGDFDDQWQRSYSSDPTIAGALGADMAWAEQHGGVVSTAKHFPGLGAASAAQNTDLVPVTLTQSLHDLRTIDEAAFAPVIRAGVDMVMTSWAIYPALDGVHPAGLSRRIVGGELRGRLHFRGVTITDALEAGALKPFGDMGARAVAAAGAGMDLLLCSARDIAQGAQALDALVAAAAEHHLTWWEADAAYRRVLALRHRLF